VPEVGAAETAAVTELADSATTFWVGASSLGRIGSAARGVRRLIAHRDGRLVLEDPIDVGPNPMFLAWSSPETMAVAHELPTGLVSTWTAHAGGLERRSAPVPTAGAAPCHLLFSADGSALYVANYSGGSVAAVRLVGPAGGRGEQVLAQAFDGSSVHPMRQQRPHPHQVVRDDARSRLLVPDLGTDRLRVLRADPSRQWRLEHDSGADIRLHAGAGPRHLVVAGRFAIVANELDTTLSVVDLIDGLERSWIPLGDGTPIRQGASAIQMTRAGSILIADRDFGGIHALAFDPSTATVERVTSIRTGGQHPRDIELTGDERTLLVADQASDSITALHLDPRGIPVAVGATVRTPAPACLLRVPASPASSAPA